MWKFPVVGPEGAEDWERGRQPTARSVDVPLALLGEVVGHGTDECGEQPVGEVVDVLGSGLLAEQVSDEGASHVRSGWSVEDVGPLLAVPRVEIGELREEAKVRVIQFDVLFAGIAEDLYVELVPNVAVERASEGSGGVDDKRRFIVILGCGLNVSQILRGGVSRSLLGSSRGGGEKEMGPGQLGARDKVATCGGRGRGGGNERHLVLLSRASCD